MASMAVPMVSPAHVVPGQADVAQIGAVGSGSAAAWPIWPRSSRGSIHSTGTDATPRSFESPTSSSSLWLLWNVTVRETPSISGCSDEAVLKQSEFINLLQNVAENNSIQFNELLIASGPVSGGRSSSDTRGQQILNETQFLLSGNTTEMMAHESMAFT